MPSVFSKPKAILVAAVDDVAISLNKEVNLCATARPQLPLHVATPTFILYTSVSMPVHFVAFPIAGAAWCPLKGLCV
jgi:hypothetical protein